MNDEQRKDSVKGKIGAVEKGHFQVNVISERSEESLCLYGR
jgi:hypothetical protein